MLNKFSFELLDLVKNLENLIPVKKANIGKIAYLSLTRCILIPKLTKRL